MTGKEHPAVMAEAIDALDSTCAQLVAGLAQAHRNNAGALQCVQQHSESIRLMTDTQMHISRSIDLLMRRLNDLEQRK